jgi:hypothetical protein
MEQLKKNYLDIESILDKIKNLPIDNKDKADILQSFKYNLQNPAINEDQNLNRIQQKYTGMQPLTNQDYYNKEQILSNQFQQPNVLPQPQYLGKQQMQVNPYPSSEVMTTMHFEILKNKMDSLQLELIDLLRHVKDYTQRYMNAVRAQDIEKITDYINGLFQVDKALKETEERSAEAAIAAEAEENEEEPLTNEGVIQKASSGFGNFFSSIGNNVSSLTSMVSNTASMANNFLSKKIINVEPPKSNVSVLTNKAAINTSKNNNILSVGEYISNMNKLEGTNTNTKTNTNTTSRNVESGNVVSSNMNMINNMKSTTQPTDKIEPTETTGDKALDSAIKQLNEKMDEDINNTVEQSGGYTKSKSKEVQLTKKIKLLKLKLTKKRLINELKNELKNENTVKTQKMIHSKINNSNGNNKKTHKNKNKSKYTSRK